MMKAGADMVFGGHTHRIQPVVKKKKFVVAYSMGNFFFPDRLITKPRSTFYPEHPLAMDSLPVTKRYPFVEQVTLKLWQPLARLGEIVTVSLAGGVISVESSFVELNAKNTLDTTSLPFLTRVVLFWQKLWLKYLPYPQYALAFSKLKSALKRLIHFR